ncbi:unnamed protein product [Urochloa decumbens]|uniref:Uncharacterized protein n=1 Tax=Urochloa decumbens TaxID=240449 RepID=A0ABC8Y9D0_9POAL
MDELAMAMAAAASSECSSGCQSGWTTYLDDHSSSYSCGAGAARFHGSGKPYYCDDYSEEDDLSMISDASSGPRHQSSAGNDVDGAGGGGGAAAARANAERRGRREAAAAVASRQSKRAAAASLLEDTASSPAFSGYSKAMGSGEANGYGVADASQLMEIANAADFSYSFSTTTGFKSPLNGTALGGYMQMQYSPAAVNPMPTRQVCRDAPEKKRW